MRENHVKHKLASGEVAVGTMVMEFATSGIARLADAAGAEFVVYDMEHTGWSMETIRTLMATSRAVGSIPVVRPPAVEYHYIARILDMGAMGVVVPFIEEPEQAEFVVRCTRYPPAGRRGAAFSVSHDDYQGGDILSKMQSSNQEVLVLALIESVRGLENVERIAAVEGVDAVWIGQFDLTTSMGIPGRLDHPDFHDAQARILKACQAAGKAAGYGSLVLNDVLAAKEQGFRLLVYTADLWIYQQALRQGLETIRGEAFRE